MSDIVTNHARHVYSVIRSGTAPEAIGVAGRVARSWSRCANDYGLDPAGRGEPQQVSPGELADRQARLDDLLAFARPEMASLSQQIARSGYVIVLTDSDGVVLSHFGDASLTGMASISRLLPGSVWSERVQGTNAMGTCLAERLPVVIQHEEHFLARNIGITCSATPIFDHQGRLIAVLDASGESQVAKQHTLLLVNRSAQRIENRLFLHRFSNDFVLRFHRRPEFVGTLGEGAIAFSAGGAILAVNRSALFQLGFRSPQDVVEQDISELFNESTQALIDLPSRHALHPGPIFEARRGGRFFATTQLPAGGRSLATPPAAGRAVRHAASPSAAACTPLDALGIGDPLMAENIRLARRVVDKDIPVLLYGETGSGKEVFARALHLSGNRADKPFVAINCASIPESLIDAELFGYKAGIFTGAARDGRRGKLFLANGGTLFLDAIGDMPVQMQARLLRVLEEREVLPLGGDEPVKVDIRLISATHCDLPAKIAAGEFRPDLYYRLQGLSFTLPPLRERGDRRELIRSILCEEAGNGVEIDDVAMDRLDRYGWPGNLRELRLVLRTVVALSEGHSITEADLPDAVRTDEFPRLPTPSMAGTPNDLSPLESAERDALMRELNRHRWNITNVARRLKISRNTLYRKMQRLNIRDPNKKLLH
ncbi:MAG: sigma-54-dependent Fis family transcriptional regulator [Burkholderiales bacterium]